GYRIRVLALDADWLERASRDFSDGRRGAPRLTSSLVRDERLQQRLPEVLFQGQTVLQRRRSAEHAQVQLTQAL
ncbi:AraC family transcriptional regulator, partial [Pseudomonas aeruginosa]